MPIRYIPYFPNTIEGQAILDNFTRTTRALRYRDNDKVIDRIKRGLPRYEVEKLESINAGEETQNLLIRGECLSACAYLKDKNIKIDLVYIDPPFASGADYAKKVYIRRNPKIAEIINKAEEELEWEELRAFEEKMYGDIWDKEKYLNWMYENLMAIKSVMSENGMIFLHIDWHIGHYVKILMDEIFGEANYRNEIIVKRIKKNIRERELVKSINAATDTIYLYVTTEDVQILPPTKPEIREERWHSFEASGYRNGMDYKLFGFTPSSNNHWRWSEKKAIDAIEKGTLRANPNTGKPEYFIPATTESLCDSLWDDIPAYHFQNDYSTEKSSILLERILKLNPKSKIVVADFFGGSGVTAAVAHKLGRRFIHADIGINSIQTTRDRLLAAGASFDILEVKDGVSLFRNPQQTMDKMKDLISGLHKEDTLDKFWAGAITDSKLGKIPVYIPNLLDHNTKILDKPLINRILNEAMPDLDSGTKQVIIYYIDIEDNKELLDFIKDNNPTTIKVELRDLKQLLSEVVIDDITEYELTEKEGVFEVEIKHFVSDRLTQKINDYNQKRGLSKNQKDVLTPIEDDEESEENPKPKRKFKPIEISENGLELIEMVSLDCTATDGIWNSDNEIKIDKLGYMIQNGVKTKTFWNAKITSEQKPFRLKIRNIAGDESIILL